MKHSNKLVTRSVLQQTMSHVLCLLMLLPSMTFALPSDREQPIHVASDTADIDNQKGTSIYRGNVVITQGTTKITGDIVTLYLKDQQLQKMVAKGLKKNRAYYEEEQENNKGTMKAWGDKIVYDMATDTVDLITNAELEQKGDSFKGDTIVYNRLAQQVTAKGATKQNSSSQIQMVIQPRQSTNKQSTTK